MKWTLGKKWIVIAAVLTMCIVSVAPHSAAASTKDISWVGQSLGVISEFPPGVAEADRCSQHWIRTEVESIGITSACVSGDWGGVRVGWYLGPRAVRSYIIAYPYSQTFYRLYGACGITAECMYSQKYDVFIAGTNLPGKGQVHAFISDFSKKLTRPASDPKSYLFSGIENETFVSLAPGVIVSSNSLVMSNNGEWALLELHAYGFVRVNLQTLQYKRVYPTGARYGVGNDPAFELGISDDGSRIAIADWKAGVKILEITPECGEPLSMLSPNYGYAAPDVACPVVIENLMSVVPGMFHAVYLNFSSDGRWLSLYNFSAPEPYKLIIGPHAEAYRQTGGYVAFGDSFSSGEGETSDQHYIPGTNTDTNKCHVSDRSYPYLLGMKWGIVATNQACSGSVLTQVWKASGDYFTKATGEMMPSVVSVGVGGNDIGLMGKLKTCLGVGTCEWAKPAVRANTAHEIRQFLPRLSTYLQELKRTFPRSKVMVVGYPDVVNTAKDAPCDAVIHQLLDDTERQYLSESVKYLNKVLELAARRNDVAFVDVSQAYGMSRLCDASPIAMNSLRFGDDFSPLAFLEKFKIIGAESFHPTPIGHDMVARAISTRFVTPESILACGDCSQSDAFLEAGDYWGQLSQDASTIRVQVHEQMLAQSQVTKGQSVAIKLPAATFKPLSSVRIELHSSPTLLAELTANDDGSLDTSVVIPAVDLGYHSIHVYGISQSDDPLDLYDFITIVDEAVTTTLSATNGSESSVARRPQLATGTATAATQVHSEAQGHPLQAVPTVTPAQVLGVVAAPASTPQSISHEQQLPVAMVMALIGGFVGILLATLVYWCYEKRKNVKIVT